MAKLTMEEAAEAVGKTRSTIWRATKSGTLSSEKNEHGVTVIDTSELDRVYKISPAWLKRQASGNDDAESDATQQGSNATRATLRNSDLEAEIRLLRERFDMAGQMHEERLKNLNVRIEELRQDREDMRVERDKLLATVLEQATSVRLLTNQTVAPAAASPESTSAPIATTGSGGRRKLFGIFGR